MESARERRTAATWVSDAAFAAALLVLGIGGTAPAGHNQAGADHPTMAAYLLVAIAAVACAARRRLPYMTMAVCTAAMVTHFLMGFPFGPILLVGPVAVYGLAAAVPLRQAVATTAGFLVATTTSVAPRFRPDPDPQWLGFLAWVIAWSAVTVLPAAIGVAVRTRREAAATVAAELARRAVSEERLLMAQDLHDSVGHGLAVIAMQSGVALHVLDRDPVRARESLEAIRDTSREALDGLRAQVALLRAPGDAAQRRPAPGIDDLAVLVERMRGGGLPLSLVMEVPMSVPEAVSGAAYRIVQESLTNVLRHAPGASTDVRLERSGDELVRVANAPTGQASHRIDEGSGLTGMRTRAAAVGGELTAGPGPAGGWVVRAVLPLTRVEAVP